MNHDQLIELLEPGLRACLDQGEFFPQGLEDENLRSLPQFLGWLTHLSAELQERTGFPSAVDLDEPFATLLKRPLFLGIDGCTVRDAFIAMLLAPGLSTMVRHVRETSKKSAVALEVAQTPWWRDPLGSEAGCTFLIKLAERVAEILGDRPAREIFLKHPAPGRLLRWVPEMDTEFGDLLRTRKVQTPVGTVKVKVTRYETLGEPVRVYEWMASIDDAPGKLPLAVACGMVYVAERDDKGLPLEGSPHSLIEVADIVSDMDAAMAEAFAEQCPDAQAIYARGDLCFVTVWERQPQLPKGAGRVLLQTAVADLRRRFTNLGCTALSVQPYQYVSVVGGLQRPAEVEADYLEAFEQLMSYCETLDGVIGMPLKLISSRALSANQALDLLRETVAKNRAAQVGLVVSRL